MFSGLIEAVGCIRTIAQSDAMQRLVIARPKPWESIALGDSIAVNGVCLTAVEITDETLSFDVIQSTLNVTSLGSLREGDYVNLERALSVQARLDGHICTGHVDHLGTILEIQPNEGAYNIRVGFDSTWAANVVDKGSIALDGISLTIVSCDRESCLVSIIPHTLKFTNLQYKQVGDAINIEFDYLGKYVVAYLKQRDA